MIREKNNNNNHNNNKNNNTKYLKNKKIQQKWKQKLCIMK